MTPEQRAAVVAEAWAWIGTPYDHHQRVKGAGVDCVQFLVAVYPSLVGIATPDTGVYPTDWHLHHSEELYIRGLEQAGAKRVIGEPSPGDIALFRFGRTFSHGGILVDKDLLLHAYLRRGVILSRVDEEPLQSRPVIYWTI